ncbi:MAG: hypothetical protein AAFY88_06895, partial [Acidobacteriota bacterium]
MKTSLQVPDQNTPHAFLEAGERLRDAADPTERRRLERPDYKGRQWAFVARCGRTPVARVLARLAPDGVGYLGFFEAVNAPDVVTPLLRHAAAWLRQRGATEVIGPMEGDPWHPYRFNLGPFEVRPFALEPRNVSIAGGVGEEEPGEAMHPIELGVES